MKFLKKENTTFKYGEPKRVGDLSDTVQRNSVLSIKIAVFNFVKEGIHPIQAHCTAQRSKQSETVLYKFILNISHDCHHNHNE